MKIRPLLTVALVGANAGAWLWCDWRLVTKVDEWRHVTNDWRELAVECVSNYERHIATHSPTRWERLPRLERETTCDGGSCSVGDAITKGAGR
jgi:hypothetical protein